MRILITNDDGLHASQLVPLIKWWQRHGEVTVFVPKVEQSGKSHSFQIKEPFEVKQVELAPDLTVWSVDSTPADCVRFAVLGKGMKFDLCISGINRGYNMGRDIMYSGTVSAVYEAANLGVKALAVSTDPKIYETATEHMDRVWDFLTKHDLFSQNEIYNVNIPVQAGDFRITRQGGPYYSDDFHRVEGDLYMPCGKDVYRKADTMERDTDAVLTGGFISVTPLTLEKTDLAVYNALLKLNP